MKAVPATYSATPPPSANAPKSSSGVEVLDGMHRLLDAEGHDDDPRHQREVQIGVDVGREPSTLARRDLRATRCSIFGREVVEVHPPHADRERDGEHRSDDDRGADRVRAPTPMPMATTDSPSARMTTRLCRSAKCAAELSRQLPPREVR